jgi:hypothetical protein
LQTASLAETFARQAVDVIVLWEKVSCQLTGE